MTMKSQTHANPHRSATRHEAQQGDVSERAAARKAAQRANFRNHLVKPLAIALIGSLGVAAAVEVPKAAKAVEKWYDYRHDPVPQPDPNGIHREVTLGQEYEVDGQEEVLDSLTAVAQAAHVPNHDWHNVRSMLITQVHKDGYPDEDTIPAGLTLNLPDDAHIGIERTGE